MTAQVMEMEERIILSEVNEESFSRMIEHANHLLLHKKFEECISWCHKGSWNTKAYPEDDSAHRACEALTLVALQAYAELDRWQEVLPFINQIYQSIENFPTSVVDACVRLHAHVEDYMTCAAMCSVWLRHEDNLEKANYSHLVETFVDCVFVVQKRWEDVKPFLDSCPGMDAAKKNSLLKRTRTLKRHIEQQAIDKIETLPMEETAPADKEICTNNREQSGNLGQLQMVLRTISQGVRSTAVAIYSHLHVFTHPMVKNAALFIMLLYLLLSRANLGGENALRAALREKYARPLTATSDLLADLHLTIHVYKKQNKLSLHRENGRSKLKSWSIKLLKLACL